jgi:hypothetical protein
MNGSLAEFVHCLERENLYTKRANKKFLNLRVVFQQPEAAPPVEMDDDDDTENLGGGANANDVPQADNSGDLFFGGNNSDSEVDPHVSPTVLGSSSAAATAATAATAANSPRDPVTDLRLARTPVTAKATATAEHLNSIQSANADAQTPYRPAFRPHGNRIGRQHVLLECQITSITVGSITEGGDVRPKRKNLLEPETCFIAQNWQGDRDSFYTPTCDSSFLGVGSLKFGVFVSCRRCISVRGMLTNFGLGAT